MHIEKLDEGATLVVDGHVRSGAFDRPFRTPAFERVDLSGLGPFVPLLRARQRFWFGFALTHPEVHFATILIDLGVAVVSALYVYERATGSLHEYTSFALGRHGRVATHPWDDRSFVHRSGHRVEFHHELDRHRHSIAIDVAAKGSAPALRAELVMHEDARTSPPLVVSVPTRGRWFMYTHKAHAPASGTLEIGDRRYVLDASRDFLSIDEHKAAYPYVQEWTWASFVGRAADGTMLAANLCANAHYTDPEHGNENRLFTGDRIEPLSAIDFEFDRADPRSTWRIRDRRGAVDLSFTPVGRKEQHTGAGPYRLDYFQAFGWFRGSIVDASGRRHAVDDLWGVAEEGIGRN